MNESVRFIAGLLFDALVVPGCFFMEVMDAIGCPLLVDGGPILPAIFAISFASIGGWGLAITLLFSYWPAFVIWLTFIAFLLWRASWCRNNEDL